MMEEQSASQKSTLTGWQAASNAERVRTATTVLPIMISVAAVLSVFFSGVYLILGRPWQWAWGGIFVTVQAMAFFALAYALARQGHLAAALYLTTLELNFGALIAATWLEGWLVVPVLANFMAIGFTRVMANRIQSRVVVLMSGIALVTEILLVSLGRFEKWTSPFWLQLVVTIAVAIVVMLLTALILDSRDKRYEDSLARAEVYAIELEAHWAMLEQNAAQLAILNDIGGQIAAVLELDSVLERAVRLVQESFGYHHVALFTLDREQGELVMRAGAGQFNPLFPPDHRLNLGQGMVGWVGLHGKTLLANDVDAEPRHINFYPDMIPTRSELSVPIRVGEEVVGVLDVQSPQLNTFDENDVLAMQTLADQLAIALRNAQLYQETVQRLKEVETLDAVTTALTHSLDLDQVLQAIVDSATHLIPGSTSGMIHLANEELGKLIPRATSPEVHIQQELEMPIGEGIAGLVMQEKRLINVPNVEKDPRFLTMDAASSYKSLLTAPLMIDGDCIGTLSLNSSQVGAFNADDERLLTTLAAQATIAVRNARLHQEVQRRVEELTFLNRVGRAVTSSLDLEQVLMRVMEETTHVLGTEVGSILLLDQERNELVFEAAVGPRAKEVKGLRLPLGQGVAGWVAREGQRLLVPDVREDPHFYPGMDETVGFVTKSVLAVPLKVKGKVIGAIEAVNKVEGDFSQEDVALLSSMAQWAAIAIENARLYEGIQQERASLAQRVAERTVELSVANVELARAIRLKDEFLATMSHELRTPLNAILGMSEALHEKVYGPLNEKQLKSLCSIEESGHHLLSLINDILDVSKIEAGKIELEVGPVSVEPVCRASLELIKQDAHKKRLKISSSFDNAVTIIQADGRRLKQILVNLLSNAVKFTPEGGALGLEVVGDAEREAVHFTVWDTGIGILEEDMGRLFQPFVQLDSSLSRRYAGTGLGLSLVYRLADMHGGSVSLESEVGKGSRFTVSLPWQKVAEEVERSVESVEGEGKGAPRAVPPTPDAPLLLLVEDNEENIKTLADYLGAKGYRVVVARDGAEAIERAREESPDLILMDIQMRGMDGLEATRRIRADADLGSIPIIALTALTMPGDRERCLAAGADEYLSKPASLKKLVKAVEAQLS
jgi:signal transduction histidine kinase/CheY-like chemotaxis protein/low affinity Fe/Cu permease